MLPRQAADAQAPAVITILHFNDVYEIEPIEAGHFGGLSRVATVLQQLKRTRAPVLSVLAVLSTKKRPQPYGAPLTP